uniref:Uncharacterized protein n=1 Tax=Cucumis melo TaxID=3656 RepID=A0A9I9EFV0_CUCME
MNCALGKLLIPDILLYASRRDFSLDVLLYASREPLIPDVFYADVFFGIGKSPISCSGNLIGAYYVVNFDFPFPSLLFSHRLKASSWFNATNNAKSNPSLKNPVVARQRPRRGGGSSWEGLHEVTALKASWCSQFNVCKASLERRDASTQHYNVVGFLQIRTYVSSVMFEASWKLKLKREEECQRNRLSGKKEWACLDKRVLLLLVMVMTEKPSFWTLYEGVNRWGGAMRKRVMVPWDVPGKLKFGEISRAKEGINIIEVDGGCIENCIEIYIVKTSTRSASKIEFDNLSKYFFSYFTHVSLVTLPLLLHYALLDRSPLMDLDLDEVFLLSFPFVFIISFDRYLRRNSTQNSQKSSRLNQRKF